MDQNVKCERGVQVICMNRVASFPSSTSRSLRMELRSYSYPRKTSRFLTCARTRSGGSTLRWGEILSISCHLIPQRPFSLTVIARHRHASHQHPPYISLPSFEDNVSIGLCTYIPFSIPHLLS